MQGQRGWLIKNLISLPLSKQEKTYLGIYHILDNEIFIIGTAKRLSVLILTPCQLVEVMQNQISKSISGRISGL